MQIRERTLIFLTISTLPMNLQVFVWDSLQEKIQVLKNHEKAKI